MKLHRIIGIATALIAGVIQPAAAQTTIDFNSQSCGGNAIVSSVIDQGFTFSAGHFHTLCLAPAFTNGTVTIGHEGGSLGLPITMTNGSTFSFDAFDGARLFAPGSAGGFPDADFIHLLGNIFGGGTVSTQFGLATSGFNTYNLDASWTNLTSVVFTGLLPGNGNAGYQLDNLVVNSPRTSVVPEPSTYLLMAAGLLAVGAAARARKKA